MVTKRTLREFSDLDSEYIRGKADALLRASKKEDMDFAYILKKAEDIIRFCKDVSFDIQKCRAQSMEELIEVFIHFRGLSREQAIIATREWKIRQCQKCNEHYALPLRKDDKTLCPYCYKEVKIEKWP